MIFVLIFHLWPALYSWSSIKSFITDQQRRNVFKWELVRGHSSRFFAILIQFYSARSSLLIVPNQVVFRSQAVMIIGQTGTYLLGFWQDMEGRYITHWHSGLISKTQWNGLLFSFYVVFCFVCDPFKSSNVFSWPLVRVFDFNLDVSSLIEEGFLLRFLDSRGCSASGEAKVLTVKSKNLKVGGK